MKFIFKAIAAVLVAVSLLFGFLYFYTGGMTRVADDYFIAVAAKDHDQAKTLLSDMVAEDAVLIYQYLENNDMHTIKNASWNLRQFVNAKGSIAGEVINANGISIPTRIDFLKEDDEWKIYAIANQKQQTTLKPTEPSIQQQENLVIHSMSYFMEAARNKSMQVFYQHISKFWQAQTTVAELDQAFASIYKFSGDYGIFSKIKPTIESGLIDENNLLVINGYFPLNSSRVVVTQKYIYEAIRWQLISFSYTTE